MDSKAGARLRDDNSFQPEGETAHQVIMEQLAYQQEAPDRYQPVPANKFLELARKTYSQKSTFDFVVALLGYVVFALLYPVIALGIKLNSRGPVFYKQPRTGRDGEEFICYKFRTMHSLNLKRIDGKPVITGEDDKRIFRFGRWLRKTNLDELPQVINVLKGEMSVVGPRPYDVKECRYWNDIFDDHFYRYAVKPGISGYAQVLGYRGGTLDEESMRIRLDKDLVYIRKQSLFFDLKIVFETLRQMLHLKTGAH